MGIYKSGVKAIESLERTSKVLRVKCVNMDIRDPAFADKKGREALVTECESTIKAAKDMLSNENNAHMQQRLRDVITHTTDYLVRVSTPPVKAPFAESP